MSDMLSVCILALAHKTQQNCHGPWLIVVEGSITEHSHALGIIRVCTSLATTPERACIVGAETSGGLLNKSGS